MSKYDRELFRLVPTYPTLEMIEAFMRTHERATKDKSPVPPFLSAYEAMLNAAPKLRT